MATFSTQIKPRKNAETLQSQGLQLPSSFSRRGNFSLGKAIHVEELVQPGKAHEQRGFDLLQELGVSAERARFALTHGNWEALENVGLEDFLVALADNCWKGKRSEQLESRTVTLLSAISGRPTWDCYSELDDILASLAADADDRLAWQREFETARPGAL